MGLYDNLPMELDGSPTWDRDGRGGSGTREWMARWELCSDGTPPSWAPIPFSTLFAPGSDMVCTRLRARPATSADTVAGGTRPNYAVGVLTAEYSSGPFSDSRPRTRRGSITESLDLGNGHIIRIPRKSIARTRIIDWNPYLEARIDSCVGRLNNQPFFGYDAETMLMEAADVDDYWNPIINAYSATVVFNVIINPRGWNVFYQSDSGLWEREAVDPYETADFTVLPWGS